MQKNNRFYTFLSSSSSEKKNYIRRVRIFDKLLNKSVAGLGLFVIITLVGLGIFLRNTSFAKPAATAATQSENSAQNSQKAEYKPISYDKPDSDIDITYDAAGQGTARQMTPAEIEAQQKEMEGGIQKVVKTSGAAFLPTMWAHVGRITNEFGQRRNPFGGYSYEFHAGMDISGDTGDVVVAPANGVVSKAGWLGGYGNMVEINHGNGLTTRYGHLSRIGVHAGDKLQRGQILGLMGSTGRSTGPHLHFEVRLNDRPINPRRFLPPQTADVARLQPHN
ncbi:MAG TPA: M23 family metallopeptidase [Pyrinomonadaceae bacterium]|nr:M23 family metallopeptidase [Pyrinomonadaceae bacterium]